MHIPTRQEKTSTIALYFLMRTDHLELMSDLLTGPQPIFKPPIFQLNSQNRRQPAFREAKHLIVLLITHCPSFVKVKPANYRNFRVPIRRKAGPNTYDDASEPAFYARIKYNKNRKILVYLQNWAFAGKVSEKSGKSCTGSSEPRKRGPHHD
jgi:hypothetical protein